jgi:hypothetical protein
LHWNIKVYVCRCIFIAEFQWEPDCLHLKIRMRHYVEWLVGEADLNNPLRLFDKTKYSCYIDYKYMKDMFKDQPHLLEVNFALNNWLHCLDILLEINLKDFSLIQWENLKCVVTMNCQKRRKITQVLNFRSLHTWNLV